MSYLVSDAYGKCAFQRPRRHFNESSPQQAGGVLRKSKFVSHLKAWNRRIELRGIQPY